MKKVAFASKPRQTTPDAATADDWVVMPRKLDVGEPTKRLTIDVPASLHQRVKCRCAMRGHKMADVIREILERDFPAELDPE